MSLQSRFRAAMLLTLAVWAPALAQMPPQSAQPERVQTAATTGRSPRVKLPGLPHLGTVSSQLYRGAQPANGGFAELKKLGIDIVVNLRHETDEIARERALVEGQNMQYVSIPWRGKQDPKTEQVAQFLRLLRANPDKKVFLHCERGAERTGVMVACYRISSEHWTAEQALTEMEAFRFRGLRFGHLKDFVRAFPTLLLADPFLKNVNIADRQ
jgi:tyrosine-protein phosphatase SIW14